MSLFVTSLRGQKVSAFALLLAALAMCAVFASSALAAPTVSNVRAAQRAGANFVDVYYDLSGAESGGTTVSVALSGDGGASYGLPVSSLSGDVGSGVRNALNRRIVWDAGTDKPDFTSATMRLRVTASGTPPALAGFAMIPAGSFSMGDSFAEGGNEELPVHTVTLSAFYMATTETTKAQWDAVYTWGLANGYTDLYAGAGKANNHPVLTVSWYDVVKWCNAASEQAGLTPCYTVGGAVYRTGEVEPVINYGANGYRLPTEAEWEKAARGGLSAQRFPWGDTITHNQANYYVHSSNGTTNYFAYDLSPTRGFHPSYETGVWPNTAPVGSFGANGYGLYEMAGNVWEWCGDWYGNGYYGSSPSSDPRGPTSGDYRIFRGGTFLEWARTCGVSARSYWHPDYRHGSGFVGFRLARSL